MRKEATEFDKREMGGGRGMCSNHLSRQLALDGLGRMLNDQTTKGCGISSL
jgi:hypothetical protein